MTRRDFFRNLSIGTVALPGVVQGIRPAPLPALTVRGVMSGISGHYQKVIMTTNSILRNSFIRLPWYTKIAVEAGPEVRDAVVISNYFKWDSAPFWARMVNLSRRY